MGGIKAHYDCIKAFSETDFTEDLKAIDVPTLVMHGDDDQIVPIATALAGRQAGEERHAEGLPGPGARAVHDQPRSDQRGPAGFHSILNIVTPGRMRVAEGTTSEPSATAQTARA